MPEFSENIEIPVRSMFIRFLVPILLAAAMPAQAQRNLAVGKLCGAVSPCGTALTERP